MDKFDLTPDPKVLIALTHTALKPMDALSELIDNAIDSFTIAENMGKPVEFPLVLISLPSNAELRQNEGCLQVRDNGPGMTPSMAEKALKAGFSGNNPYDSLGLFGMGLNIATGKMGSRTTLITATEGDEKAIKVVVDLIQIQAAKSYEVIPELIDKPEGFKHGTVIQVDRWWPQGNPNYGFISKVVGKSRPLVRRTIGRRYASFLKESHVRIQIDNEYCEPFEHCVWAPHRFVERTGHGKIPAVFNFNEVVGSQTRCVDCFALIPNDDAACAACGSRSFRTIEERIKGWVGIQRFDSSNHYGVDLIRNGRAIRVLEQGAFFEFTDDYGQTVKDYPIDSTYGRIVGEVHLNHVPVDFMKQDFQRSSSEWLSAMSFLRGDSSLQPKQEGAKDNESYIYKLYQGYRRVRRVGKHDMYMGYWDGNKACRIGRDVEKEYFNRFEKKEPGFYDDAEWWKLVEAADTPPLEDLEECPECSAENLKDADCCQICGHVLIGKTCAKCGAEIPLSASSCMHCGVSQVPEVEEPWRCLICRTTNPADDENCSSCGALRGTLNPCSPEYLREQSDKSEQLSIQNCSIELSDGAYSTGVDVNCFIARNPIKNHRGVLLPAVIDKGESIDIFIFRQHPVFQILSYEPEELISNEVAAYIHATNARFVGSAEHTLANLTWKIMDKYWSEALADNVEKVREDAKALFAEILDRLPELFKDEAVDIFNALDDADKKQLVENLNDEGMIENISALKESGGYLSYISYSSLVKIFIQYPAKFFDGAVWSEPFHSIPDISDNIMEQVRSNTRSTYQNCLEDCCAFLTARRPDRIIIRRARSSLDFLQKKFEG